MVASLNARTITYVIAILILSLAGLSFWWFAGVSGEIFLVGEDGSVRPAPGAYIVVYSTTLDKTTPQYLLSESSGNRKYLDRSLKLMAAARAKPSKIEEIESASKLVNMDYCTTVRLHATQFFGTPVETLNADRQGRFSVRLRPGMYVILVAGHAGSVDAVWMEDVSLKWRSTVRLVEPACKY